MTIDAYLTLIGATLFLCGIAYAWYITHSPARPGLACLGVAAGCAFTNLGFSVAIWIWSRDWRPIAAIWVAYGLTGGPMLLFKKFQEEKRKADTMNYANRLMNRRAKHYDD